MGQQSLAEFMGLHVHLDWVFNDNLKRNGPEIQRKNNFIINTGDGTKYGGKFRPVTKACQMVIKITPTAMG